MCKDVFECCHVVVAQVLSHAWNKMNWHALLWMRYCLGICEQILYEVLNLVLWKGSKKLSYVKELVWILNGLKVLCFHELITVYMLRPRFPSVLWDSKKCDCDDWLHRWRRWVWLWCYASTWVWTLRMLSRPHPAQGLSAGLVRHFGPISKIVL